MLSILMGSLAVDFTDVTESTGLPQFGDAVNEGDMNLGSNRHPQPPQENGHEM
jgi:hypothetical protein